MADRPLRILNVVGARPNLVKIAPLLTAYRRAGGFEPILVHTGQHYDDALSGRFFRDLDIPPPDASLGVGGGSHAVQTAEIMKAFEPVVLERRPDAVLVVGDVNSTLACGLVAAKLGVPLVHVEAGLRSGDRGMPEEINRVLTDAVSDLLFCTEQAAVDNLLREGIDAGAIHLVGNLVIDALLAHRARFERSSILAALGAAPGGYGLVTLHRPSNVDDPAVLARILEALGRIQAELPLVVPAHPRLRAALARPAAARAVAAMERLRVIEPLGYLDFLKLVSAARVVLTDSGGVQEETTVLGVPCLTLRDNTERPVTLQAGANRLAGTTAAGIVDAFRAAPPPRRSPPAPPWWDGRSAGRIAAVLRDKLRPGARVRAAAP